MAGEFQLFYNDSLPPPITITLLRCALHSTAFFLSNFIRPKASAFKVQRGSIPDALMVKDDTSLV